MAEALAFAADSNKRAAPKTGVVEVPLGLLPLESADFRDMLCG